MFKNSNSIFSPRNSTISNSNTIAPIPTKDTNYAYLADLKGYQPIGDYALKNDLKEYQPVGNYASKTDLSNLSNVNVAGALSTPKIKLSDRWSLQDEAGILVFRDNNSTTGDHRYALFPGEYVDLHKTIASQPIGDYALHTDLSKFQPIGDYALHTDLSKYQPKGDYASKSDISNIKEFTTSKIKLSDRWSIQDENGILTFRDNLSKGDNRYALIPGKYVNL